MIVLGMGLWAMAQMVDCRPQAVLIKDAKVLIGEQWQLRDLRLRDGLIEAIAPELDPASDERLLSAAGFFVTPGLIDAHAHLFEIGGPYPDGWNEPPYTLAMASNARALLESGVTSARIHLFDLKYGPDFKRLAADPCHPSPRLSIGGPGIFGDRPGLVARQVRGLADSVMADEVLQEYAAAGVDWLALHELPSFDESTLQAAIEAARRHGIRLMADGSSVAAVELALDRGLDTIEYLPQDGLLPRETLARLKSSSATVVPPIGFYRRIARATEAVSPVAVLGLPRLLPQQQRDRFRRDFDDWLAGDGYYDDAASLLALREQSFQALSAAGVRMVPGSDAGSAGQYHDQSIWIELEAWQELGISAIETLQAATELSAAALGLTDIGVIAPGRRADLVIFDGAPARETIAYVIKGGALQLSPD